jgi:very-short-patch-repair endonuclease
VRIPVWNWHQALALMLDPPAHMARNTVFVFPQTPVGNYSVDYLLGVAPPFWREPDGKRRYQAFIVEADGLRYHGLDPLDADPGRIRRDLDRERLIRDETGLDVLRFAGPEIHYRLDTVGEVLAAYVEGRIVHAMHGLAAGRDLARLAIGLARHPALRPLFHNHAAQADLARLRAQHAAVEAEAHALLPPPTGAEDADALHAPGRPVTLRQALDVALDNIAAAMTARAVAEADA